MSTINPATREIQAKIVYYGPGLSGKTTTLKSIHDSIRPESRGQLVSLATEGDRTLFFDFLPLTVEQVNGLTLRLQLYTVPGQIFYEATRQLVLNGADGVVFVADSQGAASDANQESLASLERNLQALGHDRATFPFAFQWNKRDLPGAAPVAALRAMLNPLGHPEFLSVASRGEGVMDPLKEVTRRVLAGLRARIPTPPRRATQPGAGAEPPPAAGTAAGMAPATAAAAAGAPQAGLPSPGERPAFSLSAPSSVGPQPEPPTPLRMAPLPARGTLSFAKLFTVGAGQLHEVEQAIREGRPTTAVRAATQGVADVLGGLEVLERSDAARAALLGIDGRDYLKLLRLSRLPEGLATEADALFALHVLVGARLRADSV